MYEELMEQAVEAGNAQRALKAVNRNRGAAGIDGMKTSQLKPHLERHWEKIRDKLLKGIYRPSPARRVEIPKPTGGKRLLGIPTVLDRFIQQLLLQVMSPIFEPKFSDQSYGFRPGRSAHDAVREARQFVLEGKDWVVDIDITKFFDRVHHDILMAKIGKTIRDRRVLRLIGRYLRSGVMVDGVVIREDRGTPQGGPLSPVLANIYLDTLDQELEKRGHCFVRYADDCNIYVGGPAAADHLLRKLPKWIQKHLRLEVNASKSGAGRPWERKFLGFRITEKGQIEVSPESLKRYKTRVRALWRSGQSLTNQQLRDQWLRFIRGWWNYYRLAEWRRPVFDLDGWVRRHIRKFYWRRWHNWKGRRNALKRLGAHPRLISNAYSSLGPWRMGNHFAMRWALRNAVLRRYRFWMPSDLAKQTA